VYCKTNKTHARQRQATLDVAASLLVTLVLCIACKHLSPLQWLASSCDALQQKVTKGQEGGEQQWESESRMYLAILTLLNPAIEMVVQYGFGILDSIQSWTIANGLLQVTNIEPGYFRGNI